MTTTKQWVFQQSELILSENLRQIYENISTVYSAVICHSNLVFIVSITLFTDCLSLGPGNLKRESLKLSYRLIN